MNKKDASYFLFAIGMLVTIFAVTSHSGTYLSIGLGTFAINQLMFL